MNIELLRKKMEEYYSKTTPRQIVRELEAMGVEFENIKPRNLQDKYKMRNNLARKILDETPSEVKESVMISALKQYLVETPTDQIMSDWNVVKDLNISGPTVKEFMRNNLFQESLSQIKPEATEKIQKYTDMIDEVEKIIDEAYKLYMPQVRSEITDLARMVESDILKKFREATKENKFSYNILEIGTKFGGTFYIWNSLNKLGKNISIDLSDGGIHGGVSEEEMDKRDLWFAERFYNCHFIRGDSHLLETKLEFAKFSTADRMYRPFLDFLFIDGDHSYEGVQKDFLDYSPFVNKGGMIAFHDIVISDRHHDRNVYVGEFWKDLTGIRSVENDNICVYDGQLYEVVEFVEPGNDWAGIGVLAKL